MLGSPSPATATIHSSTPTATTPTRPSRLRGLSYLRNYTQNHLHSSSTRAEPSERSPPLARTTSGPAGTLSTASRQATQEREENDNTMASAADSGIQSADFARIPVLVAQRLATPDEQVPSSNTVSSSAAQAQESDGDTTPTGPTTRSRPATSTRPTPASSSATSLEEASASSAMTGPSAAQSATQAKDNQPSIRFIPHVETRSSRPSLHFSAISKTLKGPNMVVRVGRYSERDTAAADDNTLPVGFKSKVVSRRHCEFWCTSGQWYVKDVKSSSGTFLNHVRLSSPGVESRPYPVNDGDVVQLGIDFKGGEEIIFRCVKIRVECNRGWQKGLNNFNTSTHQRLLKTALGKGKRDSDTASVNSSECSICLNAVAPCQALFVAPCSHVWHYKCVRNLIHGASWPNFLCPNCRFVADLEADVEPPEEEEFEELPFMTEENGQEVEQSGDIAGSSDDAANGAELGTRAISESDEDTGDDMATPGGSTRIDNIDRTASISNAELSDILASTSLHNPPSTAAIGLRSPFAEIASSSSTSLPVPIRARSQQREESAGLSGAVSTTPTSNLQFVVAAGGLPDGPMTPRNDIGPFVLDGSAGRAGGSRDGFDRVE